MTSRIEVSEIYRVELSDPWDARWLATEWPEAFSVFSDALGIIEIHDMYEAEKLTGVVELCTGDDDEELLRVHGVEHALVPA